MKQEGRNQSQIIKQLNKCSRVGSSVVRDGQEQNELLKQGDEQLTTGSTERKEFNRRPPGSVRRWQKGRETRMGNDQYEGPGVKVHIPSQDVKSRPQA